VHSKSSVHIDKKSQLMLIKK